MFRWATIKTVDTAGNIVLMTNEHLQGSMSSLGNRDCWHFLNVSFHEVIESSLAFSDLISTRMRFFDLCLGGVALAIASQGSIEFILTFFLLKFWKCSWSSDVASIRFLRISSSDSILFLSNGRSLFLMLSFLNPTRVSNNCPL